MNFSQRQDLQVQQNLYLTPELKQGIAVLQMNALDLGEYVRKCAEENPFFDEDEEPASAAASGESGAANELGQKVVGRYDRFRTTVSSDELLASRGHGSPETFADERKDRLPRTFSFDRYLTESESLDDHLIEQLHLQTNDARTRAIGEYLIGNIDSNGYLGISVGDAAAALGVPQTEVEGVLAVIQQFNPIGVGARNLAECVTLQLRERGELTPQLERLISEHFADFERRTPTAIAHDMGITLAELTELLTVIRSCNPRPAAQFGHSSNVVLPEIVVERAEDGIYTVRLQDFYLPRLAISEQYRTLASTVKNRKTAAYLKEKLKEAESLIGNIQYRKTSLYKIACYVVEMQTDFLEHGFDHIYPLTMAQAAEAVGVSVSTVSRIVNDNYMQTPRGVFELKFFFHSSAYSTTASVVSSVSVKRRIEELVEAEDPAHPLSDQAIADALADAGVPISRRTVNKYRDELGIPARAARRRR